MLQTRKDLLQAHRLMTRRAALALLQAEPDPPDQPLRRLNVGMFSSVLVAGIVAAVFGIWGLIAPGQARRPDRPGLAAHRPGDRDARMSRASTGSCARC